MQSPQRYSIPGFALAEEGENYGTAISLDYSLCDGAPISVEVVWH